MLTPVPATLPDSNLSPSDIMAKFSPQSLAGLGCGPYGMGGLGDDDDSDLVDLLNQLPTGSSGGDASTTVDIPNLIPVGTFDSGSASGNYLASIGINPANVSVGSNGTVTVSGPTTSSGLSAQQQASLIQSLISGGVNLAELGLVQPGTTLTAGGITRQNPGATTQGTPLTGGVITSGNSGLLMIGLLAIGGIALFAFSRNR
jgi:hypothetical protein